MTTEIKNNGGSLIEIKVGGIVVATFDSTGLATGIKAGSVDVTALATAVKPLGVGQSWQNVLASRSTGVLYTNTTGRPITVAIRHSQVGGNESYITVDGLVLQGGLQNGVGGYQGYSVVVPGGSTYRVDGGNTILSWHELR